MFILTGWIWLVPQTPVDSVEEKTLLIRVDYFIDENDVISQDFGWDDGRMRKCSAMHLVYLDMLEDYRETCCYGRKMSLCDEIEKK